MIRYSEDEEFDAQLRAWVERRQAWYRANREEVDRDNAEWRAWLKGHPRHRPPAGVEVRAARGDSPAKARSRRIRRLLKDYRGESITAKAISGRIGCTEAQARRSLAWLKRAGEASSTPSGWKYGK